MPLDAIFFNFSLALDAWFLDGVPGAVQGALAWVRNPMRFAMGLYVIIQASAMLFGEASGRSVAMAVVRAACVAAILESPNYTRYVQDAFLTDLPAQMAAALNGPRIEANAARQFDVLRDAMNNMTALVLVRAPGMFGSIDRGVAHVINWVGAGGIGAMWLFWYVPRLLTGIVVCLGPFVMGAWLFKGTRFIAFGWLGKLVSLLALTLSASVLVRLLLSSITRRMLVIQANPGASIDLMISNLGALALLMWFGALLMLVLPAAITFGSGVGAATGAIIGRMAGAAGAGIGAASAPVRAYLR